MFSVKYKKKPIAIEAFQWTGGPDQVEDPEWIVDKIKDGTVTFYDLDNSEVMLYIQNIDGTNMVSQGDYIIKGIKGEIYSCKPDIFEMTYEFVE